MNPTLEHGEVYGSLKVLRKIPSGRYVCGCECGNPHVIVRAKPLMSGRVKHCYRDVHRVPNHLIEPR
jgi:hypothetical protein